MLRYLWFYVTLIVASNARSPCDDVTFVDRNGWGANPPTSITNLTAKPLSFYVIHHSYLPGSCYDDETCIQRVRDIQRFHQVDRGWVDIGYHFLVGENGKVYEGRGWNRQGAHAPSWNNDAFGICIIGDFTKSPPNEKALNAVRSWIGCGIDRGHVTPVYYIITHRQSQRPNYTECPGDAAFNTVKTWPRFCSFQNSGETPPNNQTIPSFARAYCAQSSSSPMTFSYFLTIILLLVLL